jgi:ribonuclease P protein component
MESGGEPFAPEEARDSSSGTRPDLCGPMGSARNSRGKDKSSYHTCDLPIPDVLSTALWMGWRLRSTTGQSLYWAAAGTGGCWYSKRQSNEVDEADLPTEEAQAGSHARVSVPVGNTRGPRGAPAPAPEGPRAADRLVAMPQRRRRLSRSAEFDRVYRHGRSVASRHLVLYGFPRDESEAVDSPDRPEKSGDDRVPRLGVSVGRRVGPAVSRNAVKRLLREAFWSLAEVLPPGHDYVVVARGDTAKLAEREGLAGVERELRGLVEELNRSQKGGGGDA